MAVLTGDATGILADAEAEGAGVAAKEGGVEAGVCVCDVMAGAGSLAIRRMTTCAPCWTRPMGT